MFARKHLLYPLGSKTRTSKRSPISYGGPMFAKQLADGTHQTLHLLLYGFGFGLRDAAGMKIMRLEWNKAAGYSLMLRA